MIERTTQYNCSTGYIEGKNQRYDQFNTFQGSTRICAILLRATAAPTKIAVVKRNLLFRVDYHQTLEITADKLRGQRAALLHQSSERLMEPSTT
jgi:hypothetical protein